MKATGNTTKRIRAAAMILTMIVFSATFSVGQANPTAINIAAYGFSLLGESASALSITTDHRFIETELEDAIELEPWMSEFGIASGPAVEEAEPESEPLLEDWMTDLSTWSIQ